jgi:hypothetical protein
MAECCRIVGAAARVTRLLGEYGVIEADQLKQAVDSFGWEQQQEEP